MKKVIKSRRFPGGSGAEVAEPRFEPMGTKSPQGHGEEGQSRCEANNGGSLHSPSLAANPSDAKACLIDLLKKTGLSLGAWIRESRTDMRVLSHSSELNAQSRRVCAAIGVFDGLHLGHQQVVRRMLSDARQWDALSVAITFDRHPNAVVAPDRAPPMLYTNRQKLKALEDMGVDVVWMIPFDKAVSQTPGETFVREMARDFPQLRGLSVGQDFAFGHRRSGSVALLEALGRELGFSVHGLEALSLGGEVVSSTRIRQAIQTGRLEVADQMLGRPWALSGPVVTGDKLGGKLGFPTANLETTGLVLPPRGVYAALVVVRGERHQAVVNIGIRPTLSHPTPTLRVEAHLLNYSGDLYGQELEIYFREKLREEQTFASLEKLTAQIHRDLEQARRLF